MVRTLQLTTELCQFGSAWMSQVSVQLEEPGLFLLIQLQKRRTMFVARQVNHLAWNFTGFGFCFGNFG